MKRKIQLAIGALLTAGLLWFLFRGTNWAEVGAAIAGAGKGWMLLSLALLILTFLLRAQRWSYIVRTAGPVPYSVLFDATQIGFLANFTLPARAGEAIRALVLARLTGLPLTKCLAFGFLDRVTDLFGLLAVMGVTALAYAPEQAAVMPEGFQLPEWAAGVLEPSAIRNGAGLIALAIAGLVGGLVVLYLNTGLVVRISDAVLGLVSTKFAALARGWIEHFSEGLHVLRSLRALVGALIFSLLTWGFCALGLWAALMAFDIHGPWYTALVVVSTLSIVISMPSTPGFVGAFHLGIMLGVFIAVEGVSADVAKAYAIFCHLVNLIPIAVIGVYSLARRQVGLFELEKQAERMEE